MADRLLELFADVLRCDIAQLSHDSTPHSVPAWDSLATVKLITEIEDVFGVTLTMKDVLNMHSIQHVQDIIQTKKEAGTHAS